MKTGAYKEKILHLDCIAIYHNIWYLYKNNLDKCSLCHSVRRW